VTLAAPPEVTVETPPGALEENVPPERVSVGLVRVAL
jgi:hypothetical protein